MTVTLNNYYVWTDNTFADKVFEWTIEKASFVPSVTAADRSYGDTAAPPVVSGVLGGGAVTLEYKLKSEDESGYGAEAPVLPGECTVRAKVAASTNYIGTSATADFKVTARKITVTIDDKTSGYGDQTAALTATVTSGSIWGGGGLDVYALVRRLRQTAQSALIRSRDKPSAIVTK